MKGLDEYVDEKEYFVRGIKENVRMVRGDGLKRMGRES